MQQTYSMILWAAPTKEEFKFTVNTAYNLLVALKEFGPELSPVYITTRSKKDAKLFTLSYDSLIELVNSKVNKEGDKLFLDLGYTFSFFSSLVDSDSAGISFTIGVNNPKFKNTFIVNFPESLNIFDEYTSSRLIYLFKNCIDIFNPFWGCILNSATLRKYKTLFKNNSVTSIHWVNFWGSALVNKVTEDKLSKASLYSMEKLYNKGYTLVLSKKPIDYNFEQDIELQSNVNKALGL